jgi:hypothetical protein
MDPRSERAAQVCNGFLQVADFLAQRGDHRIPVVIGWPWLINHLPAARALALPGRHPIHVALTKG